MEGRPAIVPTDARSFALMLIDRLGERAVSYASHQCLRARSRGDLLNAARWQRMAEITADLLRSEIDSVDAAAS
jgi:hypothetical protein